MRRFRRVATELNAVIPVPFFERVNNTFFNSTAVIDADGEILGLYRKMHIPDAPGYLGKYYFTPGDTGPKVWATRHARIGIGICFDQY